MMWIKRICALDSRVRIEKEMRKMGSTVSRQQVSVVTLSTIAFTVCFAVWMMFAVIGIPIKKMLDLNETQFGLLAATPVLTGSLIRLPLGMWTDKFGGRIVFFILMLSTVGPIWLMEYATEFWHFLTIGLFVGLAGGSFSVGIAYCARWFDARHRVRHGDLRRRNSGAAVTSSSRLRFSSRTAGRWFPRCTRWRCSLPRSRSGSSPIPIRPTSTARRSR
jgi:MFS family permease